jgi:hypothetical protein
MGNHMLTALVQRKSQLWKELEAIEAFENAMAENNPDILHDFKPPALPQKAVKQVTAKVASNDIMPFVVQAYSAAGGYESVKKFMKHADGKAIYWCRSTDNVMYLVDYSIRTKSGQSPKATMLFKAPDHVDIKEIKRRLIAYHSNLANNGH